MTGANSGSDRRNSIVRVKGGNKYEVERLVAKGGMGAVFAALDLKCRRVVALKVLGDGSGAVDENVRRFVEEAQITSQLEHPNIVPVHELGDDDEGNVFYSMKFVQGHTLGDILNAIHRGDAEMTERYPLSALLTVFLKTCDAVAFAHAHGVVHRDLKPANIMIGEYGEVLVLDWGLARTLSDSSVHLQSENLSQPPGAVGRSGACSDTANSDIIGTPCYMAPEQALARDETDHRVDIYTLGGILYSILTLRPPIKGKNLDELMRKIVAGQIPPPASYNLCESADEPESTKLPHCPEGKVPLVLSDIAMKALALDPDDRYQSVKELQQEVEAYQNGQVWHLVIDEDFSDPDISSRWEVMGGVCEVEDGELRLKGGEPQMLLLKRELSGDVRIEFDCRQEGSYLNDMACIVSGVRCASAWETSVSGYQFKIGAFNNSLNVLARRDRNVWTQPAVPLKSGQVFRVRAERVGPRLRLTVNNREILRYTDSRPLAGSHRTVVGLLGWLADTRYTRIRVYSLGAPWKSDLLDIAERHLQKGHYQTAMDLFQDVLESLPDTSRQIRAVKGHDIARMREDQMRRLPGWLEHLKQAWPGVEVQMRIDNDGLTVEAPAGDISDLEPLRGIPLSVLRCGDNRISSLEPLREMPLTILNCCGNPISSLEPLRNCPLTTLFCESCKIESLEPLRGMPLSQLACAHNPLRDGLEPLKGMELEWLSCVNTGVADLEPLRGMRLTVLYADRNRIESLEPLRGMDLTTLTCSGNKISGIEPLAGMRLNALHCAANAIACLEPLRGSQVSMLSCQCNRITSLEPLKDLPLNSLICGSNPLKSIGPMVKRPPPSFLFDSDSIPTQELEWVGQVWARDFRYAAQARDVDIILALRARNVARLKELAREHRGHRYLFIARFLSWEEARELCEPLGGHLVTITSAEENEFVNSFFPFGGSWFWIGLPAHSHDGWVTGEPLEFNAFPTPEHLVIEAPTVFSCRHWYGDIVQDARNCFMIEWDE